MGVTSDFWQALRVAPPQKVPPLPLRGNLLQLAAGWLLPLVVDNASRSVATSRGRRGPLTEHGNGIRDRFRGFKALPGLC